MKTIKDKIFLAAEKITTYNADANHCDMFHGRMRDIYTANLAEEINVIEDCIIRKIESLINNKEATVMERLDLGITLRKYAKIIPDSQIDVYLKHTRDDFNYLIDLNA